MANRIDFKSLLADDKFTSDLWLHKEAQEQPDETQFAQDFANLAFQFMQDRAPALMKYLLGFEVVDRAETPQHGDLVVYYAEGAFRIGAVDFSHKEEGRVLLRQADPAARVFEFQADSFQEWGVVVCSIRRRT